MTSYVYDGAARLGNEAATFAAVPGTIGLARYVTGANALNHDECQLIFANGLGVLPIYETAGDEAEHAERGAGDAREFVAILEALGCPAGSTVAMTDDHNDGDTSQERGYFAAAHPIIAAAGYELACYSGGNTIRDVIGDGNAEVGWKVETWTQWGDYDAQLVQLANSKEPQPAGIPQSAYDVNVVAHPFPLWGREDDMAISDEQMATLGKWMQDQREVTLNVLIGAHDASKDRGVLAGWENDTRAAVTAAIAKIPTVAGQALDPKALADAIATSLGDSEAKKVADELAARLKT